MTYRPEFAFWSDADDITEHVVAFEFDHGVNILTRKPSRTGRKLVARCCWKTSMAIGRWRGWMRWA